MLAVLVALAAMACSGPSTPSSQASPTAPSIVPVSVAAGPADFSLQGDPESAQGATWTFRGTLEGVRFDLQGVLLKPRGAGPFGAVVISHGYSGSAANYARAVGREMVQWGLVCIGANYTHAGGTPIGEPGTASEPGASQANLLRARATLEILRRLGYVDLGRVAAHGHSMGAFVTAALLGAYPSEFRVASHTAGGVREGGTSVDAPAPVEAQVTGIRAPYQMHHGDADVVVALALDQRLARILQDGGVPHELHVYPGGSHSDVSQNEGMFVRVRDWYKKHGLF